MIWTLLRLAAFFISTLGYTRFIEKQFKYFSKLTWIVVFCFNILVVYFASFVMVMSYAVWGMFALGIILFINALVREGKTFIFALVKPDMVKVLMGFYLILFAWTLLQSTLVHYDNFSHWALIVKFFLQQGTLPTAADTIIEFSSYPIGSSLFVYYFTLIVGYSEGVMLLGQFVFVMACFYAMFAFVKDTRRIILVIVMFFIITVMNYFNIAIRLNNLLVDFLMPLLSLATISGIHLYQKDFKKMTFHVVITLAVLLIIKNSAFFFAALALVYYFYSVIRYHRHWSTLLGVVLALGLIFAPYLLWRFHVDTVFVNVESKHNMSFSTYIKNFDEKSTAIIKSLGTIFLKASFSLQSLALQGMILVNVLFAILGVLAHQFGRKKLHIFTDILGINLVFVIYYIGIFLMFVFSMPLDEAQELAGFERYASSIVVFALGIFALLAVIQIDQLFYTEDQEMNYRSFKTLTRKFVYQYGAMFLVFVSFCLLLSENNGMSYNHQTSLNALPEQVKAIVGDQPTYNDTKYLLVASDEEGDITSFYLQYIGRYYLFSPNVGAYSKYEMENSEFIAILKQYDVVIMVNKNYTFIEKIRQTTGMTLDEPIIEVQEILDNLN